MKKRKKKTQYTQTVSERGIIGLLGSISLISCFSYFFSFHSYNNYIGDIYDNYIMSDNMSKDTSNELKFVFVDDDNTEYEIFQKDIHGARINRDFLFGKKKDKSDEEDENNNNANNGDYQLVPENKEYVDDMIDDIKNDLDDVEISPKYTKCTLPWGEKLEHDEYTLAYQQRNDAPDICNVQKRYCENGKLSGSYKQESCKEKDTNKKINTTKDIRYGDRKIYHKTSSKNQASLIQSHDRPNKYDHAIIQKSTGNTQWTKDKKDAIREQATPNTTAGKEFSKCVSPWGEYVNHGQFIKAYKRKKGFSNKTCEVELRICLDGELQGDFKYEKCTHIDEVYEVYYSNPDNWDNDYKNEENEKSEKDATKETQNILKELLEAL